MAGVVNKAATAPGTVTVGVDATGRHYKYEKSAGRGRQPLNLSKQQSAMLAAKGLAPGKTVSMSAGDLAQIGIRGGGASAPPGAKRPAASQNSKALAAKILQSHAKWMSQPGKGKTSTAQRLRLLTANGRAEALSRAGKNPSDAHKALAASILGTIFAKGVRTGGAKSPGGEGFKVKFSPGGEGQEGYIRLESHSGEQIAGITFKNLHSITAGHVEAIREHFLKATSQPAPAETKQPEPKVAEKPVYNEHDAARADKLVKQLEKLDKPKVDKRKRQEKIEKQQGSKFYQMSRPRHDGGNPEQVDINAAEKPKRSKPTKKVPVPSAKKRSK